MSTKSISRVCFPYVGDSVGGAQISGSLLIANLDRSQYEPLVVVHEHGPLAKYLEQRSIPYTVLPLRRYVEGTVSPFQWIRSTWATAAPLMRFLRDENIDIVHAQDARMQGTWIVPARMAGARFVWHQRSRFLRLPHFRLLLRLSDAVVCNSQFVESTKPEGLQTQVVPNPFDIEGVSWSRSEGRKSVLDEIGVRSSARVVGLVGRLVDWKRPSLFLEIAAEVARNVEYEVHFLMVGSGTAETEAQLNRRSQELGISDVVHIIGPRDPVMPLIAGLDVLVATARNEPFGRTVVEAMSVGTPVVASASGGHLESVQHGETGLLVPDEDVGAFADAIRGLLETSSNASAIADRAQSEVQKYDLKVHVAEIESLYYLLLSGKGLAPS